MMASKKRWRNFDLARSCEASALFYLFLDMAWFHIYRVRRHVQVALDKHATLA